MEKEKEATRKRSLGRNTNIRVQTRLQLHLKWRVRRGVSFNKSKKMVGVKWWGRGENHPVNKEREISLE